MAVQLRLVKNQAHHLESVVQLQLPRVCLPQQPVFDLAR